MEINIDRARSGRGGEGVMGHTTYPPGTWGAIGRRDPPSLVVVQHSALLQDCRRIPGRLQSLRAMEGDGGLDRWLACSSGSHRDDSLAALVAVQAGCVRTS